MKAHYKPSQTSKIKIINGCQPLNIFAQRSTLDVWLGSEYASAFPNLSLVRSTDYAIKLHANAIKLFKSSEAVTRGVP